MNPTTIIGYAAGATTTLVALPQAIKSWRSKETDDVSLTSYLVYLIGLILWAVYGVMDKDYPILISSFFEVIPVIMVIYLKIRYDKKQ